MNREGWDMDLTEEILKDWQNWGKTETFEMVYPLGISIKVKKKKVQKCVQCTMASGSVWWVVGRKEEDIEEFKWEKNTQIKYQEEEEPNFFIKGRTTVHLGYFVIT